MAIVAAAILILRSSPKSETQGKGAEVKRTASATIAVVVEAPTSPPRVVSPEHIALAATVAPQPRPTVARRETAVVAARPPTVRPSPVAVALAVQPTAVSVPTVEPRITPAPSPTHEVVAAAFPTPARPASETVYPSNEARLTAMAEQGRVLFKTSRYKDCVELMGHLQSECLKGGNQYVCLGLRAGAALYRGASYAELGDEPAARAQFWTFLALKPKTFLSPREYSSRVIQAFNNARRMR